MHLFQLSVRLRTVGATLVVALAATGQAQGLPLQVMQYRSPSPDVTAATAPWQANNEPIVVQGLAYFPTREMRMFDGQVMTQIDVYQGVPIYADTTIEPFTLVYVPLTRDRMRTYERPHDPDYAAISGRGTATRVPWLAARAAPSSPRSEEPSSAARLAEAPEARRRPTVESIPRPRTTNGVWVDFGSSRWYLDGDAASYARDRFVQIGSYRNFPVYGERGGATDRIWIPAVNGGLLTPYTRR